MRCRIYLTHIVTLSIIITQSKQFSSYVKIVAMGGTFSWIQTKVMGKEEPVYNFPSTLDEFGYYFNQEGQLRTKESDEPFEFSVREGDYHYNQKHYNALGDIITEKIYQMMEKDYKLQRSYLPVNAEEGEPRTFVFISGDLYTNSDKLMILVHGSGAVRAGQWARRLIINDCLDSGSQLPYIKWARENGYSVIVANPNINTGELPHSKKKKPIPIKGNASPEEHMESLWREFVQRSAAKHIAFVAHSYGGVCTVELVKNHLREFEERVFAIAFTDSVHGLRSPEAEPEVVSYYKQHVVNWASAYDPLDAPLITTTDEVPTVSAGTDKHEYTSYSSMHSIFKFFKEKYEETVNPSSKTKSNTETTPAIGGQREGEETKEVANQNKEQTNTDQSGADMNESDQPAMEQAESSQSGSESKVSDQSAKEQAESSQSGSESKESDQSGTVKDSKSVPEDNVVTVDEINPEVKSEL